MSYDDIEKKMEILEQNIINNSNRIENNLSKIQENSYALEIIKDYKKSNRKLFMVVILLILAIITLGIHHIIGC